MPEGCVYHELPLLVYSLEVIDDFVYLFVFIDSERGTRPLAIMMMNKHK
jgi:hypothetical protein